MSDYAGERIAKVREITKVVKSLWIHKSLYFSDLRLAISLHYSKPEARELRELGSKEEKDMKNRIVVMTAVAGIKRSRILTKNHRQKFSVLDGTRTSMRCATIRTRPRPRRLLRMSI